MRDKAQEVSVVLTYVPLIINMFQLGLQQGPPCGIQQHQFRQQGLVPSAAVDLVLPITFTSGYTRCKQYRVTLEWEPELHVTALRVLLPSNRSSIVPYICNIKYQLIQSNRLP